MSHTPGPWVIYGEKDLPKVDDLMVVAFDIAGGGEDTGSSLYVCNIGSDGGRFSWTAPVDAGQNWPVSLANARLIAAAPELLAACRAMMECCGSADNWVGETEAALRLIEAAVARAEGG